MPEHGAPSEELVQWHRERAASGNGRQAVFLPPRLTSKAIIDLLLDELDISAYRLSQLIDAPTPSVVYSWTKGGVVPSPKYLQRMMVLLILERRGAFDTKQFQAGRFWVEFDRAAASPEGVRFVE